MKKLKKLEEMIDNFIKNKKNKPIKKIEMRFIRPKTLDEKLDEIKKEIKENRTAINEINQNEKDLKRKKVNNEVYKAEVFGKENI